MDSESTEKNIQGSESTRPRNLKNNLVVDPENGPYKTIQEAIDAAEPGNVIKISPGLYNNGLVIDKPNLRLEPKDKLGDIILVVGSKPAITINLKPDQRCTVVGMKMSHSGNNETDRAQGERDIDNMFKPTEEINPDTRDPYQELVDKFPISPDMNAIILVNGGILYLEDCLLSLNFIGKNNVDILPALVINEGTEAIVNKCEIKGNKSHLTIGILCRNGNLILKETKIHNHRAGGVLVRSNENNVVRIANCKIVFNDIVGVHFVGEDSSPNLEANRIENNNGPGVKIGIASKAKIIKNSIKLNQDGIVVQSSEPHIFRNKIQKNYQNGIFLQTFDSIRCDALIEKNEISANKKNGIHVAGNNNFARIVGNLRIEYNKLAGIKVEKSAHASIIRNSIYKNLAQVSSIEQFISKNKGVLIVESASGHIEKNSIVENIKANIAFGGQNSNNTTIIDNKIEFGRCGRCYIGRNHISENNEGLVCITSIPEIRNNTIIKNKSNESGIMLLKDSRALIFDNVIKNNEGIGLYIRDKSHGEIKSNKISENHIELVVERKHEALVNIKEENYIDGDVRIPQNFLCYMF